MTDFNVPFNRPATVGREFEYLADAIRRGQLSGDGHYTRLCSRRLEKITGAGCALLTHSCTAALEMAAILCDLGPGDEVIMPSFTFVSTANAVVLRGAVPVFADIDPGTLNIDPDSVKASITARTKAIFAVHYAGFPADMDALVKIARDHGLYLVEDAAQALGSTYKSRPAGSLGDMATFSFHETKNVISGEGGALMLNRPELIERAEIIREKGTDRSRFLRGEVDKYTWVDVGSSFLPGELVASFLYAQLEEEASIMARRQQHFETYMTAFAEAEQQGVIRRPQYRCDTIGNGHMFYLLLPGLAARNQFIDQMRGVGINTVFHYVPLHSSPAGMRYGRAASDLPVTDEVANRLVRLPLFHGLGEGIDEVIQASFRALGISGMSSVIPLQTTGQRGQ